MSNVTSLTELAKFRAKSPFAAENERIRQEAIKSLRDSLEPRSSRLKVSELIDIVMVRSARARRRGQARVNIDIDVFSPNNRRAVQILL